MLRDTDKKVQSSKKIHGIAIQMHLVVPVSICLHTPYQLQFVLFFFWQGRREGKGRAGPIPLRDRKEPLIRQQIFQSNFNITFVHTSTGVIHVKINLHLDCIQRWRL